MNDFFSILSKSTDDKGRYVYTVLINVEHPVFEGHFPGKPVVPGVMTLMMVRMCAEDAAQLGSTRFALVKDAKYFKPVIPDGKPVVIAFTIDEDLNLRGDLANESGVVYTSIRATLAR